MGAPVRRVGLSVAISAVIHASVAAVDAPAPAPVAPAPETGSSMVRAFDLRLGLGSSYALEEVEDDNASTTTGLDGRGGSAIDLSLVHLRTWDGGWGLAVGGGLFGRSHLARAPGSDPRVDAFGAQGQIALAYRVNRHVHIEAPTILLGIGSVQLDSNGRGDGDSGGYTSIAIQAGAYCTFALGFQLGAAIGFGGFSATIRQDVGAGVEHDLIYSGSDAFLTLDIGYRF